MAEHETPTSEGRRGWRIVDLSQPLSRDMPRWPRTDPIHAEVLADIASDGLYERRLTVPEHAGTHVDAPAHFAPAGSFVDEIPLESLVAPGQLLDLSGACRDDPDFALEASELERLEAEQEVALSPGHLAFFRFGWDRFIHDQVRYAGELDSRPAFPGLAASTGELLVARGVIGIGVDTLGVEPGLASSYPLHRITLAAGLFHIEGLVGLAQLPKQDFLAIVAPLPVRRGSGSPARVLAMVKR